MSLYLETRGQGPALVLLHGWGLNHRVWGEEVVAALAQDFHLHLLDLPGHGRSPLGAECFTLDAVCRLLDDAALPPRATWLGWSLGGLVALAMALRAPARVQGLILLASNPQFVRSPDWPHGMRPEVLQQFAEQLEQDFETTLARFLMLQVRGEAHARQRLRQLRQRVLAGGQADARALRDGLRILQESRFQAQLAQLDCPVLWLLGRLDSLVPVSLAGALRQWLPTARMHVFEHSAHAPFLSQPQDFLTRIQAFVNTPP